MLSLAVCAFSKCMFFSLLLLGGLIPNSPFRYAMMPCSLYSPILGDVVHRVEVAALPSKNVYVSTGG